MMKTELLQIDGREVKVSNADKVFYPETGFTKGEMLKYYADIGPALIPHLKDRPLSLKRYPDGVKGLFFYEKNCPSHRPDWVQTAPVWSKERGANINYCVVNDMSSLMWAANLAVLELHTSLSKKDKLDQPTAMVFDLDPGEGMNILACCKVALYVRELLHSKDLDSYPKTSGSKGLQLYVPLNSKVTFDLTKLAAHDIAIALEHEHPDEVVSKMSKALRVNKVFIDWSQNDPHKTTVCAYSMRAKDIPSVSTPVTWAEVETALKKESVEKLQFSPEDVVKRVAKSGDLFEQVLKQKQTLKARAFELASV